MARFDATTGTIASIINRLIGALPTGWFVESARNITTLLTAAGNAFSHAFSNISAIADMLRIKTSTGAMLDIVSNDFFGDGMTRGIAESDATYLMRISANLSMKKLTAHDIIYALPILFPGLVNSVVINEYSSGAAVPGQSTPIGLDDFGDSSRYGTVLLPFEATATIHVNAGAEALLMGDGSPLLMEGGANEIDLQLISSAGVAAVIEMLRNIKPVGTVVWVTIVNP